MNLTKGETPKTKGEKKPNDGERRKCVTTPVSDPIYCCIYSLLLWTQYEGVLLRIYRLYYPPSSSFSASSSSSSSAAASASLAFVSSLFPF